MADNYLEKRAEELRLGSGQKLLPQKPSLEKLLQRIASFGSELDSSYRVHSLQLEAIVRAKGPESDICSLKILQNENGESCIDVIAASEICPEFFFRLGMTVQNLVLKAAELGLSCRIEFKSDKLVRLHIGRSL